MIEFDYNAKGFVDENDLNDEIELARSFVQRAQEDEFGGWVDLPINYNKEEFNRIKTAAERINLNSEYLVCIGIGGSYLGHRAVISALGNNSRTKVIYAGNSLSPYEIEKVLEEIGDSNFSINIISKSGTTTEPAVAFRIFKERLIEKYGEAEAARRIYATTDAKKGALHDEAVEKGYESFVVPDNIGGRYSVLSAVGLLPILVAGVDIDKLMDGAEEERAALISDGGAAAEYAGLRNALLKKGFDVEVLANFEPSFMYFNEWWKQLFGESEGKEQKGIFPASVIYTTDLHSMGQYMQEGRRNLFETFVKIKQAHKGVKVPKFGEDLDGLAYLEGKELSYISKKANEATEKAHFAGGMPALSVPMPDLDEYLLGTMISLIGICLALSGFCLGVNPFNQPGVEAYKTKMFELLGKPGYDK